MSNTRVATRNALTLSWKAVMAAQRREERARREAARYELFGPLGSGKPEPADPRDDEMSARDYWLREMGYEE